MEDGVVRLDAPLEAAAGHLAGTGGSKAHPMRQPGTGVLDWRVVGASSGSVVTHQEHALLCCSG